MLNFNQWSNHAPLHFAVKYNQPKAIETLLKMKADVNIESNVSGTLCSPLKLAKGHSERKACLFLLEAVAEIEEGMSTIHLAARRGDAPAIEDIVAQGTDVNVRDNCSRTALHWDILRNHPTCIRSLVKMKADVNIRDT